MLASGASLRAVQETGGWTSLRMLERYAHPTDSEKRRAVDLMASYTKVGTKTGTAASRKVAGHPRTVGKVLKAKQKTWRPQGGWVPTGTIDLWRQFRAA